MIADTAAAFSDAYLDGAELAPDRPSAMRAALLVTPRGFRVNEAAATDNRYMVPGTPIDLVRAHAQHQALARELSELGLPVVLVSGQPGLDDAVYPNNVYATTSDRAIIGAMRHPVRQREAAREDVRGLLTGLLKKKLWDLSGRDLVAELTGPLVLDRARGIGICGLTGRADRAGAAAMHEAFGLRLTYVCDLVPEEYHTNLVLALLAGRGAVVYPPSFRDPDGVLAVLRQIYGDEGVLVLSDAEKAAFCGNCLAVTDRVVMMSRTAGAALTGASRRRLAAWGFDIATPDVTELEKGGGSLRCLICELF